jgi:hypothetical protein
LADKQVKSKNLCKGSAKIAEKHQKKTKLQKSVAKKSAARASKKIAAKSSKKRDLKPMDTEIKWLVIKNATYAHSISRK